MERDITIHGVDENGNPTIDLPKTRLGNVEPGAVIKDAPSEGDYIPIIDAADNQMKKVPVGAIGGANPDDISGVSARLEALEDRVLALEIASGAEVTANPFAVTFGSLDGLAVDGIWDTANSRLEF